MRASSDPTILALDAAVRSPQVARHVQAALHRAAEILQQTDRVMAWETLPLDLFDELPSEIRSCWVFLLRASEETGAERHPNSHQRSLSVAGSGEFQLRLDGQWQSHRVRSDPETAIDSRWVTIPPNTRHRWLVGSSDWSVLSFHTVPADQLLEERPTSSEDLDLGPTERRRYQDQA